ncbi:hypothetical protein ETAE_0478 [Edwardsiella piscicida]|uniref:Uncharacterized protein n=1 Tax=Edwardsiella piscicida TaxID=1263550 RepID=A0AAU8P2A5_EDWPI|nr:hypothetical protein ETAE_0478 [Edwardsiella tarda EIB202]
MIFYSVLSCPARERAQTAAIGGQHRRKWVISALFSLIYSG